MRILITTDVVGGVWSYTEELVDALAARGHTIALVAFGGQPNRSQRAWLASRPQLELATVPCHLEWMPEPEPGLSASVEALRTMAARFGPDVLHLNQFYYGGFEFGTPKLIVAHSDVVTWWHVVKGAEPPDDEWFRRYRAWVRQGLAGAQLRVAPSAWFARQVATTYDAAPVRPVHNGRSAMHRARRPADRGQAPGPGDARGERGRALGARDEVAHRRTGSAYERTGSAHGQTGSAYERTGSAYGQTGSAYRRTRSAGHGQTGSAVHRSTGLAERRSLAAPERRAARVVAAGRLWDEAKGARDLIRAAARLGAGADVVVAGPVRHPAGGPDFPADSPGIRWVGQLAFAELHAILRETRVYAATSRYEPFGLAPLEAVLAGCALVASDIPTFRELWDGCALFYPPGDGDALADAVGELLDDDERRCRLARAARLRALARYSPERMAAGYEALYRELLARPKVSAALDSTSCRA